MTTPPEATPFLAQVPVAELVPHLSAGGHACSAPPTTVRRRRGLSRVGKRLASVLFLGLGIMSMLSLGRGAAAAVSDGLSGDDTVVLAMLGLISVVVASQAFSLLRALPGTRNIWKWVARARQRRTAPTAGRPLLAQADARAVLPHLPAATPRDGGGRLRPAARTAGWVALTLVIMAAAIAGAGLVGVSAIRSVDARGWGLGTIVGLAVAALIGYGLTAMSIGLIRSWFEVRRRRMRRMLMRLLRYLLRGFDRSAAAAHHLPAGVQGATGVLGHGALATGGAAVVVAASLVMPVSALEGTVTNAHDPGSTSTSIVHAVNVDHGAAARFAPAGSESEDGAADVLVSDPRQDGFTATTLAPIAADTTSTTGAHATAATARTPTKTSVTSKPTTTTTTTVAPRDATGPVVSRISDGPDPIFTAGNKPDTTQINFTTSDTSGVATVNIYYRLGSGSFALWATPKPGTASTTFGPFAKTGTYEYRIRATDTLGTTNCKTPATCPGGTVTVTTNTKPTTTTTTTTTTVAPRDATGPVVSRISDGPDPIFTAGNKPDTTQINFTTSDTSGVATVNIYYRLGSGSFALWATPKPGTASTTFGPFAKTGTYEYRIRATDTLGNTNCKTPATCPGGTVTVTTNTKPTTTTTTTATTTTTTTVAPGK